MPFTDDTYSLPDGSLVTTGLRSAATQHNTPLTDIASALTTVKTAATASSDAVTALEAREIASGTGLTGGGTLAATRTIALSSTSIASLALADSAVQPARTVTGGSGLTGGGDLSTDQVITLDAGSVASLAKADSAIQSLVAGQSTSIDTTDPQNPVVNFTGTGTGDMLAANNLSDLNSAPTARKNLAIAPHVADRTALKALDTTKDVSAYLKEAGREGQFVWDGSDLSATVTLDTAEGVYVAPTSDATGASGAWARIFDGPVMAQWFGVKADGTADDYAAIIKARDFCWANNNITLAFPDGVYAHSDTLEFAKEDWACIALGKQVTFKHTGTGVAISLNGLTQDPNYGVFNMTFGGAHRFAVLGNGASTSVGVYMNNMHHCDIKADIEEVGGVCFRADPYKDFTNTALGSSGFGAGILSKLDIRVSEGNAGGPFTVTPATGFAAVGDGSGDTGSVPYSLVDCDITLIIESCGGDGNYGTYLTYFVGNTVKGSSEGNNSGGLALTTGSSRNTFINVFNELNAKTGAAPDWQIDGDFNTFIGCTGVGDSLGGATDSYSTVNGHHNKFIGGAFQKLTNNGDYNSFEGTDLRVSATIASGAANTKLDRCKVASLTDNSTTTTITACEGVADKYPAVTDATGTSLEAGVSNYTISGDPPCRSFALPGGMAGVEGAFQVSAAFAGGATVMTLPAGYRPASRQFIYAQNLTTDATVKLTLNVNGTVVLRGSGSALAASDIVAIEPSSFRKA